MKPFKISQEEKIERIKDYLGRDFRQAEIARELNISPQLVYYWVKKIKKGKK